MDDLLNEMGGMGRLFGAQKPASLQTLDPCEDLANLELYRRVSHLTGAQKRRLFDSLLLSDPSLLEVAKSVRYESSSSSTPPDASLTINTNDSSPCVAASSALAQNGRIFPLELLNHIFELFDFATLTSAQLVCRLWRAEILADPSHWKRLFFEQCTFVKSVAHSANNSKDAEKDAAEGKTRLLEDTRDEEGYFLFERDWKAFYYYCKRNYFDRRAPQIVLDAISMLTVTAHTNPNQHGARAINPEGAQNFLYSILGDSIMPRMHGQYFESQQRGATPIWFDWDGAKGCWWWSPDRDWWIQCPEVTVTGGVWFNQKPVEANQAVIRFLGQHPYAPTFIKKSLCFTTLTLAEANQPGRANAAERFNFMPDDAYENDFGDGGGGNEQLPNCQQQ